MAVKGSKHVPLATVKDEKAGVTDMFWSFAASLSKEGVMDMTKGDFMPPMTVVKGISATTLVNVLKVFLLLVVVLL